MTSNSTGIPSPYLNPNTSLAFLPPPLAAQLEATRYLSIAALAAFTWDLLCTSGLDYRLLTRYAINVPTMVYFLSRLASLAHITVTTLFHVAPVTSCRELPKVIGWCWAVAIPSTSLLFFFRVRAVYNGNRVVIFLFSILWLATLAGAISVPFALAGGFIAHTKRCVPTAVKPFSSASIISSTCFDTLVFITVSWGIITRTTVNGGVRSFFSGRNMPHLSRELLRGGQQYYLLTVGGNFFIMAMILSPNTPPLLKDMFPVINMALENSMACRVFRNIKLSMTGSNHPQSLTEIGGISSLQQPHPMRPLNEIAVKPMQVPMVTITKTMETFDENKDFSVGNFGANREGYV